MIFQLELGTIFLSLRCYFISTAAYKKANYDI